MKSYYFFFISSALFQLILVKNLLEFLRHSNDTAHLKRSWVLRSNWLRKVHHVETIGCVCMYITYLDTELCMFYLHGYVYILLSLLLEHSWRHYILQTYYIFVVFSHIDSLPLNCSGRVAHFSHVRAHA